MNEPENERKKKRSETINCRRWKTREQLHHLKIQTDSPIDGLIRSIIGIALNHRRIVWFFRWPEWTVGGSIINLSFNLNFIQTFLCQFVKWFCVEWRVGCSSCNHIVLYHYITIDWSYVIHSGRYGQTIDALENQADVKYEQIMLLWEKYV